MGPLLFMLLLQSVVQQLQEVERLNLNIWYLDNGTLVKTLPALWAAWDILVEEGRQGWIFLKSGQILSGILFLKLWKFTQNRKKY